MAQRRSLEVVGAITHRGQAFLTTRLRLRSTETGNPPRRDEKPLAESGEYTYDMGKSSLVQTSPQVPCK